MSYYRKGVQFYCCTALLVTALANMYGCRKRENPPLTVRLPTHLLEGEYVWHGKITTWIDGKDSLVDGMVSDGIYVVDDTTLKMASDARQNYAWSGPSIVYTYSSSNDTEVVYKKGGSSIAFNFVSGRVKWTQGTSVFYGVAGASEKWKGLSDVYLERERNWRCTKRYYLAPLNDTTVPLPDRYASAFSLFAEFSGENRSALTFGGADSTAAFYFVYEYSAGPNKLSTTGEIRYYFNGDSVGMEYTYPVSFPTSYKFSSF